MMMQQSTPEMRNLILAILLSAGMVFGWQIFVEQPKREAALEQMQAQRAANPAADTELPQTPQENKTLVEKPRSERVAADPRIRIATESVHGSLNLRGLRLDDLTLAQYHMTPDTTSPEVELLAPAGGKDTYFAEFGWLPGTAGIATPNANTMWQAAPGVDPRIQLSQGRQFTASWDNGAGIKFSQTISAKDTFLFEIEQTVRNDSGQPVKLYPYALISRTYEDTGEHMYILHEGPIGVFNQELTEVEYETLRDDGKQDFQQVKGWLGITDKYWLAALIPDQSMPVSAGMNHFNRDGSDKYQVDYRGEAITLQPGETRAIKNHFFAGAKKVALLDQYSETYNIPLFDRAVDFGMLYFLTKPIFQALVYFYHLLGNFGLAIMALTVCIKLLLFPLANKSYVAMSQLKLLMPKITELRERFGDDKLKLNQEIMELYKREKVNPASGCLPLLLQIPVFFALYKVLYVTIEMRHAPFYGWIHDLSSKDPTNIFTLFGLIPWGPPEMLHVGAWPIIMCVTMVIQQQVNPKPNDPTQAAVMQWLPYIFLFMFASFPAGLVIYWAWNNTLSILQQLFITHRHRTKYGIK